MYGLLRNIWKGFGLFCIRIEEVMEAMGDNVLYHKHKRTNNQLEMPYAR